MRARADDVRECLILGHRLEVYVREDQWRVVVDGEETLAHFGNAYAAWAAGVAESYRQGKTRACRSRAAEERVRPPPAGT